MRTHRNIFFLFTFLVLSGFGNAQEFVDIKNTATCEKSLDISRFKRFGPTTPPETFGVGKSTDFNRPLHPTWYKFTVDRDGVLLFDIIPNNPKDNYDFMLFADEPDLCKKIAEGKTIPFRANYEPCNDSLKGSTGLSFSKLHGGYEKGIAVKKGETYFLALNNVYENGKGHTIVFKNLINYIVAGTVLNQKNEHNLTAVVELKNTANPEIYSKIVTEKGGFALNIGLSAENTEEQYELSAFSEKYFPYIKVLTSDEIKNLAGKSFDIQLTKLKKGYTNEELAPIYFMPNDLEIVPSSNSSLDKLLRLMQNNSKIEIQLEGHTNGIYPSTEVDQKLSESRSALIKTFLAERGIDPVRIQTKGMGSTKEIYEMPENEEQEGYNRRVEVNILKF